MMLRHGLLTLIIGIVAAKTMLASTPARLVGESRRTMERLDEIAAAEKQNQVERAFELSLRLAEQAGQDWVPLADGSYYVTVRQYLLERIRNDAKMAQLYRDRFETRAAEQFKNAKARHDGKLLQQIAVDLSPTETATAAMEALGDLSFEQGEFPQARHWWQKASQRLPLANAATVRAKHILAQVACREPIDQQLLQWKKDYPEAQGQLAGRDGKLADLLTEAIASFQKIAPTKMNRPAWPDERQGRWQLVAERVRLPGQPSASSTSMVPIVQRPNLVAEKLLLRPTIWRGHALVAHGSRLSAIQLATGGVVDVFASHDDNGADTIDGSRPMAVTLAGTRVMARLAGSKKEPGGQIVCLEQDPNQEGFRWQAVWQLSAKSLTSTGTAFFDGTPIVSGNGSLCFSWLQTVGNRTTVWLSAYSLNRMSDGPIWSIPIVELPSESDLSRCQQVTIAGPNVVYSTDAGLIVAVNAETGQPAWAFRYEPTIARPMVQPFPRRFVGDCYASGGRVFVAPADADRLFAFDAWTGQPVWPRPLFLNVTQIVGEIDGKLVVAANGQLRGVGAVDVATGKLDFSFGSLSSAAPFGNCELMSDRVLIPTRHAGLAAVNRLGEPFLLPTVLQRGVGGNVVCDGEYLIVARADEFSIFRFASTPMVKKVRE